MVRNANSILEFTKSTTSSPMPYLEGLVTKEVDGLEVLVLNVTEAVGLVPASGEDIERNLSA